MRSAIFLLMLFLTGATYSQTVLIDPAGDGGFESGTTFTANGWTLVNGSGTDYNRWCVGVNATPTAGTYCAYVSDGQSGAYGTNANYFYNANSGGSSADVCHFWRDVTFPAGEEQITLTFKWKGRGYTDASDYLRVFLAPTGTGVAEDAQVSTSYQIGASKYYNQTTWQTVSITIAPSYAGTSARLIFSWTNNSTGNTNPPAAIDEISLTSQYAEMQYSNSATTQASTAGICPGTLKNEMLRIEINTTNGPTNPLVISEITFNTSPATTDALNDIAVARLYYTGTSATFSTANQIGSLISSPSGDFTFSGLSQTLALGTNYFWLAYDLTYGATPGNVTDAIAVDFVLSGTTYNPSTTDPAGVRNILSGCAPPNDDCSSAAQIPPSGMLPGTNVNADAGIQPNDPNSISESTCNSSVDNTVFYTFTTSAAGTYSVCFTNLSCNTPNGIQASIFNQSACQATNSWGSNLACEEPMNTSDFCVTATGLAASTTYFVTVDGYAGCECSFDVYIQPSALPVELLSLDAKAGYNENTVYWSTATETSNAYFTIEASDGNGILWTTVIPGSGNSNEIKNYSFTDASPASKTYYQLKQTDFDGTSETLGTVYAEQEKNDADIYFSESSNALEIQIPEGQEALLQVFDFSGKLLYSEQLGEGSFRIKPELPASTLMTAVLQSNSQNSICKFIYSR